MPQNHFSALEYYRYMQQQAAAGNLVDAMQTFSLIERQYPTTRSYPAAARLAQQVVDRLQEDLPVRMQAAKADQDQLKKTIDFTSEPQKSVLIAQAKAEQDRAKSVIDTAIKSGAKWVPVDSRAVKIASMPCKKPRRAKAPAWPACPWRP